MITKIISYSFYLLFLLTPLVWTSFNYELFEYNKMFFTYGITVVIIGAWLLKMINHKSLILSRTPLDIPLVLFLAANILSTVFSIDPHTSIWGYYSRLNGGLLSLISYLLLYFAFVSNMDLSKIKTALKFGLASGFLISVWAILEHFGVSFSCIILKGELNDACWIQDVQARVFATLGQPNWLAVYLAMLIFPTLYFFLTSVDKYSRTTYYLLLTTYYLAFTFTYSRGPTLGLIGGMVTFITLLLLSSRRRAGSINWIPAFAGMTKHILVIPVTFLIINLLFGSALTSFRLVSKFSAPARPSISLPASPSGTQLENGGTESGQIRFIVWRGALDIFKHHPLFGTGPETFAYSYYQYRPAAHNLTSEWDFLYNKAHNEYLNYLATTGLAGFGTYILVIGTFIFWCIKRIMNHESRIMNKDHNSYFTILTSILAAYISYLIYNFFLFSVVIIAVFFYLFPAIAFVATGSVSIFHLPPSKSHFLTSILYRRKIYTKIAKGVVIVSVLYLLYSIFQLWYADTLFAKGQTASEAGNPGKAYNLLSAASELNKGEPFYKSELSFAAASSAVALQPTDATLSAFLKEDADKQISSVLKQNPNNVSYLRTAVRTYFELSTIDKKYLTDTLQALDSAIKLAPTDPKLYYNKALILDSIGQKDQELSALKQALGLKPNYPEAQTLLKEATAK